VPKINNIDWNSLIDTLLGQLQIEYKLEVTDTHITITTIPLHYQQVHDQIESALSDLPSQLPYSVEVAPLLETIPEALSRFKALLGQDRFTDIAFNPDELFNDKKGAEILDGVLYSKPTTNKRTISVWTDALNALVADLSSHSRAQLKSMWDNSTPIARISQHDSQGDINYHDIVKQNFGLRMDANNKVSVFFNFRQLWQDLFVPELATKSHIIQAPLLLGSRNKSQLVINKSHLLDYLRQEVQSDVIWRIFQSNAGPVATPLFLDGSHQVNQKTKVSIIIDRSASMGNIFEALTDNILTFIEKLEPHVEVNILFFDNTIGPRKTFRAGDIKAITAFVKSLKPQGNTYLYKALSAEFAELLKEASISDNTAVLLLTDGADGDPDKAARIRDVLAMQQRFEHMGARVPKIFTIGIGDEKDIQTLDARLSNERLIINSISEFDKVFKYINEIQYPSIERTLVVTQKPDQLSAFKVTYPQDTNVQSPDLHFKFDRDVIGVIGSHHKQIIRLKSKLLPDANVHDLVKGVLAKTREAITSKPNAANRELLLMKGNVVKLSVDKDNSYEKAALVDLADKLDQSQFEPIADVMSQRKFVEVKCNTPAFSMDYGTATQLSSSLHVTGQGHALPKASYNPAGKLNSGVQPSMTKSSSSVKVNTRINANNNQMTVQTLDNTGTEQKRFYADCMPLISEDNDMPFLYCQSDGFQSFVYPHSGHFNNQGDHYNLKSCRPISHYSMPSVVCDGETSSVVITPNLEPRPFDNLNANLALGAVLLHWGKQLYNRFTSGTTIEPPKDYLTDGALFNRKTKELQSYLSTTKKKINATKHYDAVSFHLNDIDEFQEELNNLEELFLSGKLEKTQFNEFYDKVKTFKEEIFEDCELDLNTREYKVMAPHLALKQQQDWGQLVEHKPTNASKNRGQVYR